MIVVEQLSKRYGNRDALRRISFEAQPGEVLGLLGPNGAGKTTTMRILTGFMPPSEGRALINGHDVVEDSLAVRRSVGYLPERVPVYPDMTVQGFVEFWARLRGVRRSKDRTRSVLEQFGLLDRRHQLIRNLSKGLRQRLGMAQALVHEPPVVILDEPTIGIDPVQVMEVRDHIRALRGQHTVLISSHILSEIEQICDRVIIIHEGRIAAVGTPELLSRKVQPGSQVYIAVEGEGDVRAFLMAQPGVVDVRPEDEGFVVTGSSTQDLRPVLSKAIAASENFTLLEIRRVEVRLEDIFRQLVKTKG